MTKGKYELAQRRAVRLSEMGIDLRRVCFPEGLWVRLAAVSVEDVLISISGEGDFAVAVAETVGPGRKDEGGPRESGTGYGKR